MVAVDNEQETDTSRRYSRRIGRYVCRVERQVWKRDIRTGRTLAQFPRHAGARREAVERGKQRMSSYEALQSCAKQLPGSSGINLLGKVPAETALTEAGKELSFNGKEAVSTPLQEVGYPYSVEFQLCPEKTNPISSILFQGPHSVVYTNWENTRRIAFSATVTPLFSILPPAGRSMDYDRPLKVTTKVLHFI